MPVPAPPPQSGIPPRSRTSSPSDASSGLLAPQRPSFSLHSPIAVTSVHRASTPLDQPPIPASALATAVAPTQSAAGEYDLAHVTAACEVVLGSSNLGQWVLRSYQRVD